VVRKSITALAAIQRSLTRPPRQHLLFKHDGLPGDDSKPRMLDLKVRRILVTGGAGFVGSAVVRNLLQLGVSPDNIVVPRSKDLDLRTWEHCRQAASRCDIVIHVAGITGGSEFHRTQPAAILHSNLMMGVQLMEAARLAGVQKFVTIGSATEYSPRAPVPLKESDIWLGSPETIHAPYTVAKKMLLVQAQAYRKQYGLDAIHLLMTNAYGPGDRREYVIPMTIRRIMAASGANLPYIEMAGSGDSTRDFLFVDDAAEGIVRATAQYDESAPVNLGSGREVSIGELVEIIARLMSFRGEVRFNSQATNHMTRRVLDTRCANRDFGFTAQTSLESGLQKTIDWLASA